MTWGVISRAPFVWLYEHNWERAYIEASKRIPEITPQGTAYIVPNSSPLIAFLFYF